MLRITHMWSLLPLQYSCEGGIIPILQMRIMKLGEVKFLPQRSLSLILGGGRGPITLGSISRNFQLNLLIFASVNLNNRAVLLLLGFSVWARSLVLYRGRCGCSCGSSPHSRRSPSQRTRSHPQTSQTLRIVRILWLKTLLAAEPSSIVLSCSALLFPLD